MRSKASRNTFIAFMIIISFALARGDNINDILNESILDAETLLNLSANNSNITTIIVHPGQSIQAAIQASKPGNIIEVYNGIYHENIHITKRLVIRGVDVNNELPILDADGESRAIEIMADGVHIENITVANTSGSYLDEGGIGIEVASNNCVIRGISAHNNRYGISLLDSKNCTLINNDLSDNNYGLILSSSDNNSIMDNNIGGKIDNDGAGIRLELSNNNILVNNSLNDNYNGIKLTSSANNTLMDNNARGIRDNSGFGIGLDLSNNNILVNNSLNDNYNGIKLTSSANNTLMDNNARGIRDNGGFGIGLDLSNNNILANNSLIGNYNGITLISSSNNSLLDNNAEGNGSDYGILLSYSIYNRILGNNLSKNKNGIQLVESNGNAILNNYAWGINEGIALGLDHSNNIQIDNNNISAYEYGISLVSSSYNRLTSNSMFRNKYNFQMEGIDISHFNNYIDVTNHVNNRSIYYLNNASNVTIDSTYDAGQVGCFNCTNINIIGLNLSDNGVGIILVGTDNSHIIDNVLSDLGKGVQLYLSRNNTIFSNSISNNYYGIKLDSSEGNNLSANNLSFNKYGFNFDNSNYNLLLNNYAAYNDRKGYSLDSSHNNTLLDNYASGSRYGIGVESSNNNTIFQNTLINNTEYGIVLASSHGNKLSNNYMFGSSRNFQMGIEDLSDFDNIIDATNLINGRPIYYLKDVDNEIINISSNAGMFGCFNCTNIKVIGLNISSVGMGISFIKTNFSEIGFDNISNTNYGIFLYYSNYNIIHSNKVNNSSYGIYLERSDYNLIENNSASLNISEVPIGSIDLYKYNNRFTNNSENESEIYKGGQWKFGYTMGIPNLNPNWAESIKDTRFIIPQEELEFVEGDNSIGPTKSSNGGESDGIELQKPAPAAEKITETELTNKRYYEEIESLKWGQIVFTPPGNMWKGKEETIVARISQNLSKDISEGLDKIERDKLKVSYDMSVELDGGSFFDISPKGLIQKKIPREDPQEWIWSVTPLYGGNHELTLTAYATITLNGEKDKTPDMLVFNRKILVEVDWINEAKIAIFGGSRWLIVLLITALATGLINWLSGGILNRVKSLRKDRDESPVNGEETDTEE
jgi:parallel beta-helix repeat protein